MRASGRLGASWGPGAHAAMDNPRLASNACGHMRARCLSSLWPRRPPTDTTARRSRWVTTWQTLDRPPPALLEHVEAAYGSQFRAAKKMQAKKWAHVATSLLIAYFHHKACFFMLQMACFSLFMMKNDSANVAGFDGTPWAPHSS